MRHCPSMRRRAPIAWAASSTTRTARARAGGSNRSRAAIWPYKWTGMTARVRGVMAASTAAGSMLKVPGSMSTKTGVPPALWMVPAVAKNVNGVVITSAPGFRSSAWRGSSSASVPLAQAMPCVAWASPAMAVSSRGTQGPITNCWDSITAWIAGRTSSLIARYCATRSRSGTFTTSSDPGGLGDHPQGAVRLLVARAAHGAGGLARGDQQTLAALAHPADAAGGHAHHEAVRRNVGGHHGACADERVLPERDAAHDRRVGADGRAALHEGGAVLVLARHVAARVHHVREYAGRPAHHAVLEGDAPIDRHVVLDLHVVPDARAGHDHDVLPEAAALTDDGAGHDVAEMPDLGVLADPGAGVDVAGFVDEVLRHLADHLDLELELDARLLGDGLAHVLDDLEHVGGGGVARIDDVVRMQRRHLGAADREALQASLVDQHPRRAGSPRVLEHRSAARLVERRTGLAPAEQAGPHGPEPLRRGLGQRHLRLQHDHRPEVGRAVLERDLLARHLLDLALRVHDRRLGQHLGELRSVRAGVHVHPTAHRSRDADEALHARESRLRRTARQQRRGEPGTDDRRRPLHLEAIEPLPDANHHAREAAIFDEHVRSQPQGEPR